MVEVSKKEKDKFANWEGILENAEMGKVVTRFPPEPSGYLHIGHIKAVILNRHFADIYKGKMLVRYDDTNPEKESAEFAECILEDLSAVGIKWDDLSYSTDFFGLCEQHMTKLIEKGLCYCDNTPVDKVREERDKGIPSQNRDVSPEENMKIWLQMIDKNIDKDSPIKKYCVRGKLDYKSKNKCLRDPVFFRFCDLPHFRLKDSYKLYPMYDFGTAILDHTTGVTHMLRTNEYADRIPMYRWVEEACGLGKMNIFEYSRMNLEYTVLSKRKLKWLVENKKVDGWDDPRLPTLRGILRRGVRIEAIKNLILEIGPTVNANLMQWDKLYALNRDCIDPTAKRLFAVNSQNPVLVEIENFDSSMANVTVDWHPKNKDVGQRIQLRSNKLYIEPEDSKDLAENSKVTLYKWGNSRVTKIEKNGNDEITKIYIKLTPEDLDFNKKQTRIAHWVSAVESETVPVTTFEFDHIITKVKIDDEKDKIEDIVNEKSRFEIPLLCEKSILDVKQGECIQLERRGYYYVDVNDGKNINLHLIPDGKSKSMSIISHGVDPKNLTQLTANTESSKKKKQEKAEHNKHKKDEKKEKKEKKEEANSKSETEKNEEKEKEENK